MAQGTRTVAMTTLLRNMSCPAYRSTDLSLKKEKSPVLKSLCPAPHLDLSREWKIVTALVCVRPYLFRPLPETKNRYVNALI